MYYTVYIRQPVGTAGLCFGGREGCGVVGGGGGGGGGGRAEIFES